MDLKSIIDFIEKTEHLLSKEYGFDSAIQISLSPPYNGCPSSLKLDVITRHNGSATVFFESEFSKAFKSENHVARIVASYLRLEETKN